MGGGFYKSVLNGKWIGGLGGTRGQGYAGVEEEKKRKILKFWGGKIGANERGGECANCEGGQICRARANEGKGAKAGVGGKGGQG